MNNERVYRFDLVEAFIEIGHVVDFVHFVASVVLAHDAQ